MLQNLLIVDDDPVTLNLLQKKFERRNLSSSVLIAKDGLAALQVLKEKSVSMILADLHMPKMDGFLLLDHLRENYPDIPVIIMTAYSRPKTEKVVLQRGAARFIEKPFDIDGLIHEILSLLHKETEGGSLFSASLEMFVQLLEMEQKTATIRVLDKLSGKKGVLFFKNGELLNARCHHQQGEAAAYEIFSWDEVVLFIEDNCPIEIKKINQDLHAILFEAMRLKDEAAEIDNSVPKSRNSEEPEKQTEGKQNTIDRIRNKLEAYPEETWAVENIKNDDHWNPFIEKMTQIGSIFHFGKLQACIFSQGGTSDVIIVPGEENIVVSVKSKCFHDKILQIIEE